MNDSRRGQRIKLALDWLKGIKMDIPHSGWVMFSLGVYVLSLAVVKVAEAFALLAPLFH